MQDKLPLIDWPVFPPGTTSPMVALLDHLEQSQWLGVEELERLQFKQLTTLVQHALSSVPYYRDRLPGNLSSNTEPLTPETWRRLPIVTRHDLQDHYHALKSTALTKAHG